MSNLNDAQRAVKQLMEHHKRLIDDCDENEHIVITNAIGLPFTILSIQAASGSDLIILFGFDNDARHASVAQHYSQLNIAFVVVPIVEVPEKARTIGFLID
jgi:hypothetical protein